MKCSVCSSHNHNIAQIKGSKCREKTILTVLYVLLMYNTSCILHSITFYYTSTTFLRWPSYRKMADDFQISNFILLTCCKNKGSSYSIQAVKLMVYDILCILNGNFGVLRLHSSPKRDRVSK